jgi:ornithine--oxo-acid transaminase
VNGEKYLDMLSGYGVFGLGRNHPDVRRVLTEFMQADYPSLVKMEAPLLCGLLAEDLKRRMPNQLDMVFFTNSGSEGIETAIKYAKCATRRPAVIHCKKAFHGLTYGALSLNGDESFRDGFEPFLPHCRAIPFNDLAALEEELRGVTWPLSSLSRCRARASTSLHPAICATPPSCVANTAHSLWMTKCRRAWAAPDASSPSSMRATWTRTSSCWPRPFRRLRAGRCGAVQEVDSRKSLLQHATLGGPQLDLQPGELRHGRRSGALDVLDRHNLVQRAETIGNQIGDGLRSLIPRYEFLKEVRWRGSIVGIEFGPPSSLTLKAAWTLMHQMDKSLFPQAAIIPLLDKHHIITQVAGHHIDVIKLLPPLVLSEEDVRWFLTAFEEVLEQMHKFPGPAGTSLRTSARWR